MENFAIQAFFSNFASNSLERVFRVKITKKDNQINFT